MTLGQLKTLVDKSIAEYGEDMDVQLFNAAGDLLPDKLMFGFSLQDVEALELE